MAIQAHAWIEGAKQGKIDGPCTMKGREKSFEVVALDHQVTLPFEARTGHVAGKRVHHPLVLVTSVSEASPKLYKAITGGEHLKVEIRWYRPDPKGGASEQHYFTTKLAGAKLTSIKATIPNVSESRGTTLGHHEQLSFIYDEITWTFQGGGEHIDKWVEPA
jgi:type VI secretion system secreted protein Hcp